MEYQKCQQKYCPVNKKELRNEEIKLQEKNKTCKKLFKNYSKKTIRRYGACIRKAYSTFEKINSRNSRCIQKHCKRQLNSHLKSVNNPFFAYEQSKK